MRLEQNSGTSSKGKLHYMLSGLCLLGDIISLNNVVKLGIEHRSMGSLDLLWKKYLVDIGYALDKYTFCDLSSRFKPAVPKQEICFAYHLPVLACSQIASLSVTNTTRAKKLFGNGLALWRFTAKVSLLLLFMQYFKLKMKAWRPCRS